MSTNATCLLLAILACGSASAPAQLACRPLDGQLVSQLNNLVNTASAGRPSMRGRSTMGMASPIVASHCEASATIGRSGTMTPHGMNDNHASAKSLGTSSITNICGCWTSPDAIGSSTVNNVGTWGAIGPNNVMPMPAPVKPDPLALPGSEPAGNPTGPVDGAPAGR